MIRAKRKTIGGKTIHSFGSTGEAYDRTQYDDAIKVGDVLDVPSERVAGYLYSAWPTAVTSAAGDLHELTGDPRNAPSPGYAQSHGAARSYARKRGYDLG